MSFLRFLMLLTLAIWTGGLVFLPLVAQISFSELPSPHLAGTVVRGSLIALHWIGLTGGVIYLICSLLEGQIADHHIAPFRPGHIIIVLMLGLTAVSQFELIPRMDAIQAAGKISNISGDSPIRKQFDFLHATATRVEEAVLVLAIVLLYLTMRRLTFSARE